MNTYSENVLTGMGILIDEAVSQLEFDKTIAATIQSLVNLDTGEYKVRYKSNIFSAYAENLKDSFKYGEEVYVIVPEGNFSNRKIISHKITNHSLSAAQLTQLANSVVEISPTFDELGYKAQATTEQPDPTQGYDPNGAYLKNGAYEPWGLIAGASSKAPGSMNYVSIFENTSNYTPSAANSRFAQYATQYENIRIQASFLTTLFDDHSKGDYGLEVCFYAKDENDENKTEAIYRLNHNSFTGDPYRLTVYTPQSVIIKAQKNYLLGLKYIRFYEEDFDYDHYIVNGEVDETSKVETLNLFVKDISLQYVDVQDLSDTLYYLAISAKQGISFTSTPSTLDLTGVLIYDKQDIINTSKCVCTWYKRDLSVMVGDDRYDKEVGFGWAPIDNGGSKTLTVSSTEVGISQRYKLKVLYNDTTLLFSEITLFNLTSPYQVGLAQITEGDNIYLQLDIAANLITSLTADQRYVVNDLLKYNGDVYIVTQAIEIEEKIEEGVNCRKVDIVADWYYANPDGSYIPVTGGKYKLVEGEWEEMAAEDQENAAAARIALLIVAL